MLKEENLKFVKINLSADKKNAMVKLEGRLKSLISDLQSELDKIKKENQEYEPSNSIGIIQGSASSIENLIGRIAGVNEAINSLKSLED